mmetsp:Transcript_61735/g.108126  ORF Transcript_61735/g.108126 Transcript_61735/m.108126 type:complete len:215 (+) Transcript_61735:108-752(+)
MSFLQIILLAGHAAALVGSAVGSGHKAPLRRDAPASSRRLGAHLVQLNSTKAEPQKDFPYENLKNLDKQSERLASKIQQLKDHLMKQRKLKQQQEVVNEGMKDISAAEDELESVKKHEKKVKKMERVKEGVKNATGPSASKILDEVQTQEEQEIAAAERDLEDAEQHADEAEVLMRKLQIRRIDRGPQVHHHYSGSLMIGLPFVSICVAVLAGS